MDTINIQGFTLVDEYQSSGEHEIVWFANDVASGMYLVQLQSGNLISTQKVVLLK